MPPRLTLKVILHPRTNENGTRRVRIRLYKYGKSVFIEAGFTLDTKHWNEKASFERPFWVRRSNPDFESLNGELIELRLRATFVELAHFSFTAAQVRDYLLSHPDEPLEDLQRKAIEASDIRLLLSRSPALLVHYENLLARIDQAQLGLDELKAELARVMAVQVGDSWITRPHQRGPESTDAPSKPRRANRNRF